MPQKPLQHAGPRRNSLPAGVHPRAASRQQQHRASPTSPTRWRLADRLWQLARSFSSRCSSSRWTFSGSPPQLRDARLTPPSSSGAFRPRDQRLPRAVAARVPVVRRRSGRRTALGAAESAAELVLVAWRRSTAVLGPCFPTFCAYFEAPVTATILLADDKIWTSDWYFCIFCWLVSVLDDQTTFNRV